MHGSEVLYCHSAGEPSKMERRSAASTSEMPDVAMIGGVGSLPCKTSRTVSRPLAVFQQGRICTLILVNTGDDIKKFFHAYSPMQSVSRELPGR